MKYIYLCLLLLQTVVCAAQQNRLDSLGKLTGKGDVDKQFSTYTALSDEHSKNDLDKAMYYANKALDVATKSKNKPLQAKAYNTIANIYQYKSELDHALKLHLMALSQRKLLKDSLGIADSYNNIGITYDAKGQFPQALENYFKALSYYDRKVHIDRLAMTYTNIGIVYKVQKEYAKALDYYTRANKLYEQTDDEFGKTVSAGNLGSILINFRRYEESLKYSEIAMTGYQKLGYDRYVAFPMSNIAIVLDSLNRYNEAAEGYIKSIKLHEKYGNWYESANICNAYASSLFRQKQYAECLSMSNKARNYAQKAHARLLEVDAYHNLARANAGLGNFKDAYNYSELHCRGRDSIFHEEKTRIILELDTKYETAKKEKMILIQEAKAKQRNIWLLILGLLVLSSILIGYLLYRQQKLRNKQQEQEFQLETAIAQIDTQNKLQAQRLAISRDLHDNIGAQLTFIISSVDNIRYAFDLTNSKFGNKLENISEFTKSTIAELRDTIWAMNTNEISLEDLRLRIFNLIEKARLAKEDIVFTFEQGPELVRHKFSSLKGINIYRTIQEAINNSIKYAMASEINVNVRMNGEMLVITISDNGQGFDPDEVVVGNGLINMKKRIRDAGGQISIHAEKNTGTVITITISAKP
jgi:signal transduction histidine kinase